MDTFLYLIVQGRIIKSTGQHYWILSSGSIYQGVLRGSIRLEGRKTTNPLAVGDLVNFKLHPTDEAIITDILPRSNYLIRKSVNLSKQTHILASNMDLAVLVASWKMPKTSNGFLDRFLITCEAYHIPSLLVFNKIDLLNEAETAGLENWMQDYLRIGYQAIAISAHSPDQITTHLQPWLNLKLSVFTGHSGAGKTTLLNRLCPELQLKTNAISEQHKKGKHTTTFAELHEWRPQSYIVDTPGIQEWGLMEIQANDLHRYFPEFKHYGSNCKFSSCTHSHEPECAIRLAYQAKNPLLWRYPAYLNMLESDEFNWKPWERKKN